MFVSGIQHNIIYEVIPTISLVIICNIQNYYIIDYIPCAMHSVLVTLFSL